MYRDNKTFLSADWRDIVFLNYEVVPDLLHRFVPAGTALDSFLGKTYVSIVGFRFCSTKLFGCIPVPFHSNFEEINLRFYVRRKEPEGDRRGVVFIAEIVPRQGVAITARLMYGENYVCHPTNHRVEILGSSKRVEYQWQMNECWCKLTGRSLTPPTLPADGSLEQFITEHYWGYSAQPDGRSVEYRVSHVAWQVQSCTGGFEEDAKGLYGPDLGAIIQRCPDSVFIADGSPIRVFGGRRIG